MRCYSEPVKANSERFWSAGEQMRTKLTLDFWEDTQDSLTSKKSHTYWRETRMFVGLDGRAVRIPGTKRWTDATYVCLVTSKTVKAVVMKLPHLGWWSRLGDYDASTCYFVHDEWQAECPNNMEVALALPKTMSDSYSKSEKILNWNVL